MGGRWTARRRSQTRSEENHTARQDEKVGYLATYSSGTNRRVCRGTGGCSDLKARFQLLTFPLPYSGNEWPHFCEHCKSRNLLDRLDSLHNKGCNGFELRAHILMNTFATALRSNSVRSAHRRRCEAKPSWRGALERRAPIHRTANRSHSSSKQHSAIGFTASGVDIENAFSQN